MDAGFSRARQAKSQARITAYETLLAEAKDRTPDLPRSLFHPDHGWAIWLSRQGHKGFGDRLLIEGLDFKIPPGAIVGIIGANGAGKTTLFRMITGRKAGFRTTRVSAIPTNWKCRPGVDASRRQDRLQEEISNGEDIVHLGDKQMQSRVWSL